MKRQTSQHSTINKADIDKIFLVRQLIVSDLSSPPSLKNLSTVCGLSVTKMAGLFSQIFGDTIYNYYQTIRMEKAASLLKMGAHSVSETGYQLGFVNLSHFTRVFEKHYGVKPKKYSFGESA
ncbi:helix-turn-helix transcriptional regulator [Fibrella aquatilis]|uniref:Helix-turn-helix transcriptional regulator n=1 Tax=Fibrella aquatilis TaxID=2817059 RepID=A0A939GCH1_9BACT|nr:AraC family transcriptional regulator [Fibrella aquatilis]MBO0933858.1 helix-turn-helix transcriptional regulator [Fibrella aquatilis]